MKNKTFIFILISALALMCFSAAHGQTATTNPKSDTLKCAGITAKGLQCKSTWVEDNGFCRVHNPKKITCGSPKANGEPCKQAVNQAGDKCAFHVAKLSQAEMLKFPNYKKADKEYGQDNRFSDQWCELAAKVN